MTTDQIPRASIRTRLLRALAVALIVVTVVVVFVTASVTGRGTRAAIGTARVAQSAGIDVAYHDAGSGPPVVLLASWARPVSDFNELAGALIRRGFRTIGVESRGIGGSDGGGPGTNTTIEDLARDVDAALGHAGLDVAQPVHLIGHAFGNRVARTFATIFPERAQSVTLIAAGGRVPVPQELTDALFASTLTFLPWGQRESALRRTFFAEGNEIPRYWRMGWSLWGGLAQAEAARTSDDASFWAAGNAPMLVFQAMDDAVAPPDDAGFALKADFPERVTLVEVQGAAHALLPERPEQIEAATLKFLGQFPAGATTR